MLAPAIAVAFKQATFTRIFYFTVIFVCYFHCVRFVIVFPSSLFDGHLLLTSVLPFALFTIVVAVFLLLLLILLLLVH